MAAGRRGLREKRRGFEGEEEGIERGMRERERPPGEDSFVHTQLGQRVSCYGTLKPGICTYKFYENLKNRREEQLLFAGRRH